MGDIIAVLRELQLNPLLSKNILLRNKGFLLRELAKRRGRKEGRKKEQKRWKGRRERGRNDWRKRE